MKLTVLIVDDERLSRSYIHDVVIETEPDAIVFEAESAQEALPILEREGIDVLFVDIRMPKVNGFGLLKSLETRSFDIVFVTAYSEYAIQAIKEGATDYLLKPIKKTQLVETLKKIIRKRSEKNVHRTAANKDYLLNRLGLGHQGGIKYIALEEIVYLEANSAYTNVVLSNGEKITSSKAINKFEAILSPQWFFRIHKSHIVNLLHFREYTSREGDIAVMDNGHKLHISRYRLTEFLNLVSENSGDLKI